MAGLLGIDPAKTMGFAYCMPGGPVEFGHRTLGRSGAEPGEIGVELDRLIKGLIYQFAPSLIVYEQPFLPSNFKTAFVLLGIGFHIDTMARLHGIECCSVLAMEATRALTGRAVYPGKDYAARRKAKKVATMEACRARGWKATEDEADAIAVLLLAEAKRFPAEAMQRPMVLKPASGPLFVDASAQ